jgi:hypothetical protein
LLLVHFICPGCEFRETLNNGVRFPRNPDPELFVVDLLENPGRAGVERDRVVRALAEAIASGRFDLDHLLARAKQFGTRRTRQLVERAYTLRARDAG